MLRVASALVLALLLPACGRADEEGGESPKETEAREAEKVAARCAPGESMTPEDREAVESAARAVFAQLRSGQLDALWDAVHPQARQQDDQRQAFQGALASMQRRLEGGGAEAQLVSTHFIDIKGGASALARVHCGAQGDPEAFTLITNAGDEDVAVVVLRSPGAPFGYATTVQLRRHGRGWKVLGVNVGLHDYRGRDAADYERLADAYVTQRRTVEAYLVLALAEQLANRGASLKLDRALTLTDKVDAVANSKEYQQQLGVWEVGGRSYDIQGFSVTATQSDLSVVVKYVTPTGLIQEVLDQEADALLGQLEMQHPELAKRFDAVVFEAYDSEAGATKPSGEVQAYRTARVFPEPVVEEVPGKTSRPG